MPVKLYNVEFDAAGNAVATTVVATPPQVPRVVQVEAKSLSDATKNAKVLYSLGRQR